jgi:hypothetical protein
MLDLPSFVLGSLAGCNCAASTAVRTCMLLIDHLATNRQEVGTQVLGNLGGFVVAV